MTILTCSVDGCERTGRLVRGWCKPHYTRWYRYGDPEGLPPVAEKPFNPCNEPGCDRPHEAKGYCKNHYMQYRYRENAEEIKSSQLAYREANRQAMRDRTEQWRQENPGKADEANRRWYANNKERVLNYRRKYRAENLERVLELNELHRMRRQLVEVVDLTAAQWEEIKDAWNHLCAYCGDSPEKLTKDHVIPVSKGGHHTAGNIVPACQSCNSIKGDRPAPPFYFELAA